MSYTKGYATINKVKMPPCPKCKAFQVVTNEDNPSNDSIGYECCVCGYTWELTQGVKNEQ